MSCFYTENEANLAIPAENLAAKSNTGFIEGDKLPENLLHRIKEPIYRKKIKLLVYSAFLF